MAGPIYSVGVVRSISFGKCHRAPTVWLHVLTQGCRYSLALGRKPPLIITGINDEYRKLAGDEAESNIRIDIPVPYSGVCPYVYQDENPVPISPRIATNGDVYLCQSFMDQRYCLGNINKDSLPHALFNENFINLVNFMTTGRFYMDDCNKCVLKYQCPRGCIGDCLANGSIHETDGGCFFRKENAIRQLLKQSEAIVAEHMQF